MFPCINCTLILVTPQLGQESPVKLFIKHGTPKPTVYKENKINRAAHIIKIFFNTSFILLFTVNIDFSRKDRRCFSRHINMLIFPFEFDF